jgi:three-Cys-motif partner protein
VSDQTFGGEWTEVKLNRLKSYLEAYRTIFTKNSKARYYTTWYVDAFAGTGSRSAPEAVGSDLGLLSEEDDEDVRQYKDGSAKIALALKEPFDRYLFIEKSKGKCEALQGTIDNEFASLKGRCNIRQGDSNVALCAWRNERDWTRERAVVFLDPFGLQVGWTTIESLGTTKAVDLWYLFPLNLLRMLKHDGVIEDRWKQRLGKLFGTPDWESRIYRTGTSLSLFGEVATIERDATVENVQGFIEERLGTCFAKVAKGEVLRNSRNSPLYSLCFAAANERGARTAIKIAQSILKGT